MAEPHWLHFASCLLCLQSHLPSFLGNVALVFPVKAPKPGRYPTALPLPLSDMKTARMPATHTEPPWFLEVWTCFSLVRKLSTKWSHSVVFDLCNPMDCILPGSSIHGIFQARILEWVAISFFRGSSQPRDRIQVSRTAGRLFTVWATREAPSNWQETS